MAKSGNDETVLAGDIGGTKTNLGLFQRRGRRPGAIVMESFSSQEAPGLQKIVE
jgi:glucokinase